jgi:hypothetical protein
MNNEDDKTLLVNAIITPDGTRLVSRHRHDYVEYRDANGETYVLDGGLDYVRRSVNKQPAQSACVYSTDEHLVIREQFEWGSRGVSGTEPLTYRPIARLETSHIQAIVDTQHHISPEVYRVMTDELEYRKQQTP